MTSKQNTGDMKKRITFQCKICNNVKCEDWCDHEIYVLPVCICGELMKTLGLIEDVDTEHGHVGSVERASLYVCEFEDCDNYGRVFYFDLD